ncbi:MAG TPA: radical SAM protein [bacterium]|nr:radical SAM protein [bacterium]
MDVLLFTPVDPFGYQIIPDLGLMYLASALRRAGHSVAIKDCRKEGWDLAAVEDYVRAEQPRIVGIKCYSNEAEVVARMVKAARQACPEAVIVVGGPHPSMDPRGTLPLMPEADFVFIGEAELSLPALTKWVLKGRPGPVPEEIRGIAFRDAGQVVVREVALMENLDDLPLPAWDLMRPDRYPDEAAGIFVPAFPAAPMSLSRGCPFRCSYCGCRYIAGGKIRYRTTSSILREIEMLETEYGVRTLTFVDDNFTWNKKKAMELFRALAQRPSKIRFTFPNGVRTDGIDAEILQAMEEAGCHLTALGIESGNDETLVRMNKQQTRAQIEEAVKLIRSRTRILVTGFFILGYPGEGLAEIEETVRFAVSLPIHHAHFCLFIPIPGTPVYEELVKQGRVRPDQVCFSDLTIDRASLPPPGVERRKMMRLHQLAYFRFYSRPWRMVSLLGQIRSLSHLRMIARRTLNLFR